jgi:(1->4)-alpha-D-glucan 1-alpha-D-glucosylmutase
MAPPILPRATYRLQFHKDFGFDDARRIVPYLAALGVSHLYASPLTMARPGSNHGYDVIDFNRLNPELGDEAAFEALIAELHAHDMGLLLDFVPNHMGVGSDNPWWLDVLEWGLHSPYATFFDIDWEASARGVRGKVTLPVLGDQYGKVLEAGELRLQFDVAEGTFQIAYHAERFPIAVRRYPPLLHSTANLLDRSGGPLFELADRFAALFAEDTGPAQWAVRRQEAFALKAALPPCAPPSMPRSPRRTAPSACPSPSRPCTSCWRTRPTGSRIGGSRARKSTTGAFSTSTSWPACAWSRARCSRRPIGCCSA